MAGVFAINMLLEKMAQGFAFRPGLRSVGVAAMGGSKLLQCHLKGFQVSGVSLWAPKFTCFKLVYPYWEGGQFDLKKKLMNVQSRQGAKRPTSNIEYGILPI